MEAALTAEAPIKAVLQAVRFCSNTRYAWMGERIPPLPKPLVRTWTEQSRRDWILQHLKSRIYQDFYCAGAPRPATAALDPYHGRAITPFIDRLSAANHGRGHESPDWTVEAQASEALVVSKGDLRVWVRPRNAVKPGADGRVALRFPKEFLNISPGFYVAIGDRNVEVTGDGVLLRFYFNLTPEGAIRFLEHATASLNRAGVAFRIKTVNDPNGFDRCDAVVLYVSRANFPAVSTVIAGIHPHFADALKGPAPPFTKALAPGIGLAEDPGGGESFGAHRSRALAEGLIEAHARGLSSLTGRAEVVRERFEVRQIRFDKPYLTGSRIDDYEFILPPAVRRHRPPARPATPLAAAAEISASLVRRAVWHDDVCNWVGPEPETAAATGPWSSRKAYAALGPDLYAGSSGVAVFLAELSLAAGEATARRCALGAVRHALDRATTEADFGLYTGSIGVAWAAIRVGLLLGEPELTERGGVLAAQAMSARELADDGRSDLLSGKAGAIVALLLLADLLGETALTERATTLGDALLRTAEVDAATMSWRSPDQPRGRNLTGFAHGAAGVGFGLTRLFARTGVAAYGEAALLAFAYERRWFNARAGNWRDLRSVDPGGGHARGRQPVFSTSWCHGAPGVALSRLERFAASGDAVCRAEALTALRTTAEHTRASLIAGGRGGCLCHGLAGNADILLSGARALAGDFVEGDDLARVAAETILASPAGEDEPLGLMLGLAGRGYALLRQHNSAIPSVLALGAR